jgi:hypothetical protein
MPASLAKVDRDPLQTFSTVDHAMRITTDTGRAWVSLAAEIILLKHRRHRYVSSCGLNALNEHVT